MDRLFFLLGSALAGIAVATGAFGAHGLKERVTPDRLEVWGTAVQYQMYHALALLLLAWAITRWPTQMALLNVGGWLLVAGITVFSGSLYLLVLSDTKWLGAITPIGGLAFIAGWLCLVLAAWRG